jgi:signal transduction histidine kinase/ActR/RegA family two-component response regulator
MLFSGSIRKLLAFILLVALAPNLGIIVWSNLRHGRQEMERAGVKAREVADGLGRDCERLLEGLARTLEAMAAAPSIRSLQPEPAGQYLATMLAESPDVAALHLLDARGAVLAAKGRSLGGDLAALAEAARNRNGVVLSSAAADRGMVLLALAVPGPNERSGGVLVAGVARRVVERALERPDLPEGSAVILLDGAGRLLAGRGSGLPGAGQPLRRDLWDRIAATDDEVSFAEPGREENPALYTVRPICPSGQALPCLRLLLGVPEASVLAEVRRGLALDLTLAGGVWALSLAAASVAGYYTLDRTLRRIVATTDRLRQGDLAARTGLPPAAGSLGVLAAAVDRMAASLDSAMAARLRLEQDLTAARDAAEAASRAKGEFLANMSHEIRTPLNGILGMLDILRGNGLNPEQAQYAATAAACGEHLLALLSDVLDLSRLDAGRLMLCNAPFSPRAVLEGVAAVFAPACAAKGVTFTLDLDPSLPAAVEGDSARVRQVLFNLAGNAVKFTGTGQVGLAAWARPARGGAAADLVFVVSDTGPGIADADLAKVFRRFTQADGTLTRQHQGAGLGLAIVQRVVRLLGGTLAMDSSPGQGTSAYFALRLRTAPALAEVARPAPAGPRRCLRVLVAEDDPVNQVAVQIILKRLGHRPTCVENGRQAVEALAREPFDCVLMDIQMPVMDGLAATRAIRSDPTLAHAARIPVVALTAHAMAGDRERFLASGLDRYLAKPFSMNALAELLADLADTTIAA